LASFAESGAPKNLCEIAPESRTKAHHARILLVGYLYGRGGIQSHTHWLATGLTEKGYDVEVITPAPIHDQSEPLLHEPTYPVWSYPSGLPLKSLTSAWQFARGGRYDVAIVCGTGWLAMAGVLLNRHIRKRVFFEVMSGEPNGRLDPRRLIHAGFDTVVAQASTVQEKFRSSFRWRGPITTIPALAEPLEKMVDLEPSNLKASGGLRAAYFGRLAPHKGINFLIERWDELSKHFDSLDIYGTGEQEAELAEKIAGAQLGDCVRLHGRYPAGADYARLVQRHQLVLLPTTGKEGAPLVLLEAMVCGVPFVANGVGGIPSYANPDCAITSGDIGEFLPAVAGMCARLRAGDVEARRLQKFYADNFSFAALTRRWDEFITNLIDD
jgi:glycosyltransferase involved in cell wall biosynthesis